MCSVDDLSKESRQITPQLLDETCQTNPCRTSAHKKEYYSTLSLLFAYPHYSHHHPKITKVAPYLKNNPDSAKILTSIKRKTLAFIWGLGFCYYYYWFNTLHFQILWCWEEKKQETPTQTKQKITNKQKKITKPNQWRGQTLGRTQYFIWFFSACGKCDMGR